MKCVMRLTSVFPIIAATILLSATVAWAAEEPVPAAPAAAAAPAAPAAPAAAPEATEKLLSAGELEQLVAPIALYPDDLLANVLMAATYPIEIVQADRWASKNKSLKGDPLRRCPGEGALGRHREIAGRHAPGARHDERADRLDAEARRRGPGAAGGRCRWTRCSGCVRRRRRPTISRPPRSRR